MSTPENLARRQRAALYRLFSDLFQRGRQTRRNQAVKSSSLLLRKLGPLALFSLVGLIMLLFARDSVPTLIFATMTHAMTFVMVGMTLATACGTLLFNEQESDILLHRPVPVRLILMAKVRVVVTHSLSMALALNLAALVAGVSRAGGSWRFVPAHLLTLFLQSLFSVSAVVLTFHLCLRCFGRERLNSLITTSQVVIAMAIMLGGQLVPRMMAQTDLEKWTVSPWLMALPPAWFGALDTLAVTLQPSWDLLPGALLAVGSTALLAWLAFGRMAGAYEEAVVTLNEHSASPGRKAAGGTRWTERLTYFPGIRQWLRDPVERAAFLLTAAQLTRARDVKLRMYPSIGQFAVYPLVFAVGGRHQDGEMLYGILSGFLGMITLTAISLLRYSEEYRGSELFRFAPLASPAPLFHGARKAALLLVFVPVVLVWCVLLLAISRDPVALALLIPGVITAWTISLIPGVTKPFLPFSETQVESSRMGQGCGMMILGFGGATVIGVVSGLAWKFHWFPVWLAALALGCGLCQWLMRRAIRSHGLWAED